MHDTELNALKRLLGKLVSSSLAKADNIILRTAKGLLMRLMR